MDSGTEEMTSNRPYLLRALYDWISDNGLTAYVLVDAHVHGVEVPAQAIQKGKVVLNIAAAATEQLALDDDRIHFKARFSGHSHHISIPMEAVIAIYARENGQGMMFAQDETEPPPLDGSDEPSTRPHLKVVK